jgi:hypothetical protein
LKITLIPNGNPPVHSYIAHLPDGSTAVLDQVQGHGWVLTLRYGDGTVVTQRGLFGTPEDIVAILEAEYYPAGPTT